MLAPAAFRPVPGGWGRQAAVVGVDPAGAALAGVSPVFEALCADAFEDLVELVFANQECVVLEGNLAIGLVEVERDIVVKRDHEERSEAARGWKAEDLGKERRRLLLVAAPDDGVIELPAHSMILTRAIHGCKPLRPPRVPSSDPCAQKH
jgi:hypothetical protein